VSGTESTVKRGLVAVQIGTALLVKFSVFRYYFVKCLQLQVLDCLNSEGGGSNVQRNFIIIYRSAWNDI
jgi:hypothetical protein